MKLAAAALLVVLALAGCADDNPNGGDSNPPNLITQPPVPPNTN